MRRLSPLLVLLLLAFARPVAAAEPVKLILDWLINPDHGPLIVAREKGFFAEAGLAVELVAPSDPNDPAKFLAAGQADAAILYQPQLHLAVDKGLPLVRIGTLIASPLNTVMVPADGPIKTIADLKGKKIGSSLGGLDEAYLTALLARHKLTLADVTLVDVNFNLVPGLLSHQVDAIIGGYRTVEMNQLALEKMPARAFYFEEEGIPAYDELIIATSRKLLTDPRMPKVMAAIERGALYLVNHPEESWSLFIKGRPELDDPLDRQAWADSLRRFDLSPSALARGRYQAFAKFLLDRKLIAKIPPLESYAVELAAP